MRVQDNVVQNQAATANVVQNQNANVVQNQPTTATPAQGSQSGSGTDHVQLSSASSLVALAKGMIPADKQAKFEAINAQFQAGQYKADIASTGQAVVQGHTHG